MFLEGLVRYTIGDPKQNFTAVESLHVYIFNFWLCMLINSIIIYFDPTRVYYSGSSRVREGRNISSGTSVDGWSQGTR